MSTLHTSFEGLGKALSANKLIAFSNGVNAKEAPKAGRTLFTVYNTDRKINESDSYVIDSIAQYTGEGENYHVAQHFKGFALELVQQKYTDQFEMTEEVGEYDQYSVTRALSGITGLGTSTVKAMELAAQLQLSFGVAGSYTDAQGRTVSALGADGNPHFSNTKNTTAGVTYDNLDTTAFGKTGLQNVENLGNAMVNHAGRTNPTMFNAIFFNGRNAALANTIQEYMVATGAAFGVANTNVYTHKYQVIPCEYLAALSNGSIDGSKANWWGLARIGGDNMRLEVSQMPIVHQPDLLPRNRNIVVSTSTRFAVGIRDGFDAVLATA